MNDLKICLNEESSAFEPGADANGTASWSLVNAPQKVELRLFWFTRGKGTEDVGVVKTIGFDRPLAAESRSFRFQLPGSPYSFSGKLISLIWAMELVVYPSKEVVRQEIIIAPNCREIRLDSVPQRTSTSARFSLLRS